MELSGLSSLFRSVPVFCVSSFLPEAVGAVGKWKPLLFSTFPRAHFSFVFLAPPLNPTAAEAVGMWESRAVGEIPKESWEEWESRFWISILPILRHFHGSPAARLHGLFFFLSIVRRKRNDSVPVSIM